ncbi:unnamed protein product [Dicrocoelium dendriticum]|nr:unnamed protein product [Dicrocoelium dendriticum]
MCASAATQKFIDIGANLTDKVFRGLYRGQQHHPDDLFTLLLRAFNAGLEKIIITAGSLADTEEALALARTDSRLFCTAGCHPTRCLEFQANPNAYLNAIKELAILNPDKVIAIGECGLDYDRENFCPITVQREHFVSQLRLAGELNLPLFLHCRAAHDDFIQLIEETNSVHFPNTPLHGVVHTFDGSFEDARRLLALNFYLGLNGCSLKTEENLKVVSALPVDRILLETDAPWCEIRPTHAGYKFVNTRFTYRKPQQWDPKCLVKGRNEPVNIVQVAEVVAAVKGLSPAALAAQVYENTLQVFSFPTAPSVLEDKLPVTP